MEITELTDEDEQAIRNWPRYGGAVSVFNYALGEHGWLAKFPSGGPNHRFAGREQGDLVAFAVLAETAIAEAEFYVAVRADSTGHGLGRTFTQAVLAAGQRQLSLRRIHLKVRKWHEGAIRLYASLGFEARGETALVIDGLLERFVLMDLVFPEGDP